LHKIIRHEYNYDDDREDVLPETVGQFIGICDKNGKEIYEGDIVLFEIVGLGRGKEEVVFTDGSFAIHNKEMGNLSFMEIDRKRYEIIEVIGNIHENKNLLKSK
jgi:uncharacterized phage protein (TIGR01671 family)